MDIPNRDELERMYARLIAKLLKAHGGAILEMLGDPPDLNNIPLQFWDDEARAWVAALSPFGQRVYLEAAERLLATIPAGVDWALVNQRAIEWSLSYTFDMVSGINKTTRGTLDKLRDIISGAFREGVTRADLEKLLAPTFGPVRAEMIAITEVTRAAAEGEITIGEELAKSGIKMVARWYTRNDELVCSICGEFNNKLATGYKATRRPYWMHPADNMDYEIPAHPRCRCAFGWEIP